MDVAVDDVQLQDVEVEVVLVVLRHLRVSFLVVDDILLGNKLSLLVYRSDIATAAVCFLAVGDVAATTVGERYGRTKIIGQKSLEGTLAFVAAASAAGFLLNLAGVHLMHGLIMAGVVTAAATELLPLPLNDNLTVPLASGGAMELLARLTGCA